MLVSVLNNAAMVVTGTPDQISNHVNQHVGRHRLVMSGPQQSAARLSLCDFADLGLSRISYGNQVRIACPDLEDIYHFQIVMKGQCQWRFSDTEMLLQPGQALMMNPGEKIDLTYSADCEKLIVKIPESVVRNTCIDHLGYAPKAGVLFERKVVNLQQSKSFLSCVEAMFYEASDDEVCLNGISETYRELLVRKLLNTFQNNIQEVTSPNANEDRTLQKALEYIETNIRENLAVEELAMVAGTSVRSLYNLFSQRLSITPKLYIKQRRLAEIHRELKHNTAIRNVTEVALDYSFTHLGRFSSCYKEAYGELPSETLKRRQNGR
ncbi:AraC family transcriptional regulator [Oceanobacter mangrovi]|uniref:AraC family transcriptional regulator n=1 Tax=Oceanobacter mangrovi TaxID=2862510 RepID=UPI001C8DD488|nr:AraC family transcriptional regulator [Oceanobacter mangrovi]